MRSPTIPITVNKTNERTLYCFVVSLVCPNTKQYADLSRQGKQNCSGKIKDAEIYDKGGSAHKNIAEKFMNKRFTFG
jgi:hypothetical protein